MKLSEGPQLLAPWNTVTLRSLAIGAADEMPKKVFLRDCPARESWNDMEPRSLNFDAFLKASRFFAAQLVTLGVSRGERVLILLPNCVEVPIALLGCRLAGAIPAIAPVDEKVDTLRAAAERCDAVAIVTTARVGDIAVGEKARQVAARLLSVRCVAGFGFGLPDGIVSLEGWAEEDVLPLPAFEPRPGDIGVITFLRENGAICAALRTEAQMLAEALAVATVLPLGPEQGLISLLHPGAAATLATSFTLPLKACASVQLVGPYDTSALDIAVSAAPSALLFAPDHFVARLKTGQFAKTPGGVAGILALARIASPGGEVLAPGEYPAALLVDFDERGLMIAPDWPGNGKLIVPPNMPHPASGVLPGEMPMLARTHDADQESIWSGFGAAAIVRRGDPLLAGKAA